MLDATRSQKTAVEHTSVQILGVFAWQRKNKGLERSLKTAIPQEVYESLEKEMSTLA